MSNSYNLERLEELAGGDESFIQEMIDIFLKGVDDNIKAFQGLYEENKLEEIGALAHKVKPTIDLLGINAIHQEIRDLRIEADQGDSNDKVFELIKKVNAHLAIAADELRNRP
jgi:HPt (histidine-containing phosphotransfer) domain-containing protein